MNSSEMTSLSEDDAAMRRLAAGEMEAMDVIFERWKLPLISFFYRAVGSHADAEDLALRTLERVYRAADRYRVEGHFASWLFTIARRELARRWRGWLRRPVEPAPLEFFADAAVDATDAEARRAAELEEQLLVALQGCKEREREALLLTALGRLEPEEVARVLGVSQNYLNVLLHRARKALKASFKSLLK